MRKLSRWVGALVVACACVTALLFAFMPFIPLDQGNPEPFQDVSKSMLAEANEHADTASGNTTAASDQQSGSEAADENATGYEQGAVLVKLDDNMTVEQSRGVRRAACAATNFFPIKTRAAVGLAYRP